MKVSDQLLMRDQLVDGRGGQLVDGRGGQLVDRRGAQLVDRRGAQLVDRPGDPPVDGADNPPTAAEVAEAEQLISDLTALLDAGLIEVRQHLLGPLRYGVA